MRGLLSYRSSLLFFALCAAFLAGCASSMPAKFYTLSSLKGQDAVKKSLSANRAIIVSVGPLEIPDYLDRPQIVTRSGQNELAIHEFHRWAGSLDDDMSRIFIENLSALLPADRYQVIKWIRPAQPEISNDYRVTIDITRFEGADGNTVSIKARWAVIIKDRDPVLTNTTVTEPIKSNDYPALVDAMSRAMESLSRDIADTIMSLK